MVLSGIECIFAHGLESGPWGSKIRVLADAVQAQGAIATSLDYQGIADPAQRVAILTQYLEQIDKPYVLIGSSLGAYVSTVVAQHCQPLALYLIAPAVYLPQLPHADFQLQHCPTAVIHGWQDEIVPAANALRFAQQHQAELWLLNGDHRLIEQIPQISHHLLDFLARVIPPAAAE